MSMPNTAPRPPQGAIEATYEVRLEKTEPLLKRLHDIPGMQDATLVAYTGEGA